MKSAKELVELIKSRRPVLPQDSIIEDEDEYPKFITVTNHHNAEDLYEEFSMDGRNREDLLVKLKAMKKIVPQYTRYLIDNIYGYFLYDGKCYLRDNDVFYTLEEIKHTGVSAAYHITEEDYAGCNYDIIVRVEK